MLKNRKLVAAALSASLSAPVFASGWSYESDTDKMSSVTINYASIVSKDSLNLPFPYSGRNFGRIVVRQHPKYGLDVIVSVDKGQIPCVLGCSGSIRFDSGKPERIGLNPPADHSSDTVFLRVPRYFIKKAKAAKRILIQVTMYDAGDQILEFDSPVPLQWNEAPAKRKK